MGLTKDEEDIIDDGLEDWQRSTFGLSWADFFKMILTGQPPTRP
jgi:hypothetical protein